MVSSSMCLSQCNWEKSDQYKLEISHKLVPEIVSLVYSDLWPFDIKTKSVHRYPMKNY